MRTVLAALDGSPTAGSVLETALGVGVLMGATVEAVYVQQDAGKAPTDLAERRGIALRVVDGPVEATLLSALAAPTVVAGVFGGRRTSGVAAPLGHTALHILEQANKPVVVVGPDDDDSEATPRGFRRLLVPLEGNEQSARPVADDLAPLILDDVELVVVHVFTAATVPPVMDHAGWDLSMWGEEFLARFCPTATRIDLRVGAIGGDVSETCAEVGGDLIVLSWSQNASPGHAEVVRDVLGSLSVPVLLLPAEPAGAAAGEATPLSAQQR